MAGVLPRRLGAPPVREQPRKTADRGYGSRWQKASATFRRRYPLCGMRPGGATPVMSECHDKALYTLAAQVDHVVPHRGDERLFWDSERNWQSLCRECHGRKSAMEGASNV